MKTFVEGDKSKAFCFCCSDIVQTTFFFSQCPVQRWSRDSREHPRWSLRQLQRCRCYAFSVDSGNCSSPRESWQSRVRLGCYGH